MSRELRIVSVVGTRPNFMKVAPVIRSLSERGGFDHVLIHTGQHYDDVMSRVFFEELRMPQPDVYLGIGSGSHTAQTARCWKAWSPSCASGGRMCCWFPATSIRRSPLRSAAVQLGVRVGHIEAGLRSFDRTMPEEINRVLTDQISDLLFIHSPEAREHLLRERRPENAIHDVGNTMIDTLVALRAAISARDAPTAFGVQPGRYVLVTLHRPALVDGPLLPATLAALGRLADSFDVVFPVHPRTRARIAQVDGDVLRRRGGLHLLEPLGYLDFLGLAERAAGVLTDSGGVQEETTFLGVPCFTLRDNTERPVTLTLGTNMLLGLDPARIGEIPSLIEANATKPRKVPAGWDGEAAGRIVDVLETIPPA